MPAVLAKPRCLWNKTEVQQAVVAVAEIGPEEVKLKQVFLITLAHPVQALNTEGIVLAAPGVFSCEVIAEKVRDAFARPAYVNVMA